jgi:hypothetical protein
MGPLQRKIVACMFLLMMAVPVFLSLKFILEESLILLEVDEKMETETLHSISIAKADVIWIRAGKEVLVNDEFFDVKRTELRNDSLILTGYFDTEETELLGSFKKYTERNNNGPFGKSLFKFLFSPFFHSRDEIIHETGWLSVSNQYPLFSETLPASPCLPFIHPPQV